MAETGRRERPDVGEATADPESDEPLLMAHATTPERVVFTEEGNHDGWIASDLVVEHLR